MPRGGNSGGSNTIRGNNRDNVLNGTNGDDFIFGRDGDDTLFGNDGNDSLDGGNGNDILVAGAGNDTLTGGAGADIFVIDPNSGNVVITDFENGVDRMDIQAFNINVNDPFAGQYQGYLSNVGNDTIITFYDMANNGAQVAEITLQNFDYTLIDVTDYIV